MSWQKLEKYEEGKNGVESGGAIAEKIDMLRFLENCSLALVAALIIASGIFFWREKVGVSIKYYLREQGGKEFLKMKKKRKKGRRRKKLFWLLLLSGVVFLGSKNQLYAEETKKQEAANVSWKLRENIKITPRKNKRTVEGINYYDQGVFGTFAIDKKYMEEGQVHIYALPLDKTAEQSVKQAASGVAQDYMEISDYWAEDWRKRNKSPQEKNEDNESLQAENKKVITVIFAEQGMWKLCWTGKLPDGERGTERCGGRSGKFIIDGKEPELCIDYNHYTDIGSGASSVQNVNRPIRRNLQKIVSSDCELFAKKEIEVSVKIKEDYFAPENVKINVYKTSYDKNDNKNTEISKQFKICAESWKQTEDGFCLELQFEKEGHYWFTVEYEDFMGNQLEALKTENSGETKNCLKEGRYRSPQLTVDKTAPVIKKFTYEKEAVRTDGERNYFRDPIKVFIEIEEENFNSRDFSFQNTVTWADGSFIVPLLTENEYDVVWVSRYENGKRINTGSLLIDLEGNHTFTGEARDGCGLQSNIQKGECTYDTTKPQIRLEIDESCHFVPYDSYQYFNSKKIIVKAVARDKISGVKSISCYKGEGMHSEKVEEQELNPRTDIKKEDVSVYEMTIILEKNSWKGEMSWKAEDLCGNQSRQTDSYKMILETEKTHRENSDLSIELPEADYTDEDKKIKYYRRSAEVKVKAKDTYSGIYSLKLQTLGQTKQEQSGKWETIKKEEKIDCGKREDITYEESLYINIKGSDYAESNESNPVVLKAEFEDNAGNQSKKEYKEYKIVTDSLKPEVQVQYDRNDGINGKYYNHGRTATVTVKDWNFNPSATKWEISGSNLKYQIGTWTKTEGVYRCKVKFLEDGEDYKIKVSVFDYAGNSAVWDEDMAFTIDKTAPKLKMEMSKENVSNKNYYNTPKKVFFYVEDKNIDKNRTVYFWRENMKKGKNLTLYKKENQYVSSVIFRRDGEYAVSFTCTDLAGNTSSITQPFHFIIDRTAPKIEISGVSGGMAYNGEISPAAAVTDKNIDRKSIRAVIERADGAKEKAPSGVKEIIPQGYRYTWEDFAYKKPMDGIYCLKIYGKDLAGNLASSDKRLFFTVNRFGASYQLEKGLISLLKKGYMKKERDIVITESAVNELESTLTIVKDNQEQTAVFKDSQAHNAMENYHLKRRDTSMDQNGKKGWVVRNHYVKKENFQEEGMYQITLQSRSFIEREKKKRWVNETTNELKGQKILFIVDKTPPLVQVSGLERGFYEEDSHRFILTVMDNYDFSHMIVKISYEGGRKAEREIKIVPEDLNKNHSIAEELEAYNGKQMISWKAWDKAGNCTDSETLGENISCVVTENQTVQKYYKNPAKYRMIGGGMVICVCLGGIFFKKYKKYSGLKKDKKRKDETIE